MSKFTTIAEAWLSFETVAIGDDFPDAWREQMRNVFFCGATSALMVSGLATATTSKSLGNKICVPRARVSAICAEINEFNLELQRDEDTDDEINNI